MFKKFAAALMVLTMIAGSSICLAHSSDSGHMGPRYGHNDEYDHNGPHYGHNGPRNGCDNDDYEHNGPHHNRNAN